MRSSLVASILILLLVSFSIGGATLAWFTFETDLIQNVFTAGTVRIDDWEITSESQTWEPGECNDLTWSFTNTGSKKTYVRVRPDVDMDIDYVYDPLYIAVHMEINSETAWIGVPGNDPDFTTIPSGQNWNQYFQYEPGIFTEQDPLVLLILAGSTLKEVGYAEIWDDGQYLYIDYHLYSGWYMYATHVYVDMIPPTNHSPGQFHLEYSFSPGVQEFSFETPIPFSNGGPEQYYATWDLCQGQSSSWVLGSDGWWYYGNSSGPTAVHSEETVTVCFTFCIPEGFNGTVEVALDAEAVQSSHDAIDNVWLENPWN
ncbi:MAG: hypothetical protein Q7I94_07770 [Candidatus Contubernalis sp.]|nr:hypothetical protein [Candidatus Contubernalis sp.]